MDVVDHLIVGAGTAGCVLAARLSEDPGRRVLLLEAGPDFPEGAALPAALRDGDGEGYDWRLSAVICGDRTGEVPRGRVVGGSAQVNHRGALWAPTADFDAWVPPASARTRRTGGAGPGRRQISPISRRPAAGRT